MQLCLSFCCDLIELQLWWKNYYCHFSAPDQESEECFSRLVWLQARAGAHEEAGLYSLADKEDEGAQKENQTSYHPRRRTTTGYQKGQTGLWFIALSVYMTCLYSVKHTIVFSDITYHDKQHHTVHNVTVYTEGTTLC